MHHSFGLQISLADQGTWTTWVSRRDIMNPRREQEYPQAVYSWDLNDRCLTPSGASEIFLMFAQVCL